MSNVNALLTQRTVKGTLSSKMSQMAQQTANGYLTSFSGIFSMAELSEHEKQQLNGLLEQYAKGDSHLEADLADLMSITSEVKAINNQAAMLHGERIKRAHAILTRYHEGAFTAWLIATYGNRQTPYNFWQYYEFCEAMPKDLRPRIEEMPRQAIYTLASRQGDIEQKRTIVENYQGETKSQLLSTIRDTFPLASSDKRRDNPTKKLILQIQSAVDDLKKVKEPFSLQDLASLSRLAKALEELAR